MFNTLLLLPAMFVYATRVKVEIAFYVTSLFVLLLIPIIPIIISCILGGITAYASSRSKHKNIIEIIISIIIVIAVLLFSVRPQMALNEVATKANSINSVMTKVYYPIKVYEKLILNFNITDLLAFALVHIIALGLLVVSFGKIYFKINSKIKVVRTNKTIGKCRVKKRSQNEALIKKEIAKFFSIPVFVINAAFGLVLFLLASIMITIKYDSIVESLKSMDIEFLKDTLEVYIPIMIYVLMSSAVFMTSITSSMISLEKKAFNSLKSLPITPQKIILTKVMASLVIMLPVLIIGEGILFVRFKIKIIYALFILISTLVLSLLNEMIGIIINLKYPKLDADNDAEIVKQSISSALSVLIGMALAFVTIGAAVALTIMKVPQLLSMTIITGGYVAICLLLMLYIKKKGKRLVENVG